MRLRSFRPPEPDTATPAKRRKGMNKLEARYALYLEAQKSVQQIAAYQYENVTLKLANDVRYTPDFLVVARDEEGYARIEFHEVKGGFMRDDARVKLRVAARQFPMFTFRLCRYDAKRGWTITEVEQ